MKAVIVFVVMVVALVGCVSGGKSTGKVDLIGKIYKYAAIDSNGFYNIVIMIFKNDTVFDAYKSFNRLDHQSNQYISGIWEMDNNLVRLYPKKQSISYRPGEPVYRLSGDSLVYDRGFDVFGSYLSYDNSVNYLSDTLPDPSIIQSAK